MNKKVEIFILLLFFASLMAPLSMEVAPSIRIYSFDFPLCALYVCFYIRFCLRENRIEFEKFDLFFLIFYFWLVVSSVYGKNFEKSLEGLLFWMRGYMIIFYMRRAIGTLVPEKVFFYMLGVCLILEPALAIFQDITQSSVGVVAQYFGVKDLRQSTWMIYGSYVTRPQGTFDHSNYLGNWLIMLMPFLQTRMIDERKKFRMVYVFWWLFCLSALILTYSRANWVAFLLGFAVTLFFENRYRRLGAGWQRWSVYVLIPVLLLTLAYSFFTEELQNMTDLLVTRIGRTFDDRSSSLRTDLVVGALNVLQGNPLLGVGLENSQAPIVASNPFIPRRFMATVHNIYLIVATESGIIGGVLFLIIIKWPFFRIWQALRRSNLENSRETQDNLIAFSGCFAALYFVMLWYVGMLLQAEFPLIMTLVGVALGLSSRARQNPKARPVERWTPHESIAAYSLSPATIYNRGAV